MTLMPTSLTYFWNALPNKHSRIYSIYPVKQEKEMSQATNFYLTFFICDNIIKNNTENYF